MCACTLTHKRACTKYYVRISHFANHKSRKVSYNWWSQVKLPTKQMQSFQQLASIIKPQSSPSQLLPVFSSHGPIYPHSLNTGKHTAATWPLPVPLPWIPFSSSSSLKFKKEKNTLISLYQDILPSTYFSYMVKSRNQKALDFAASRKAVITPAKILKESDFQFKM